MGADLGLHVVELDIVVVVVVTASSAVSLGLQFIASYFNIFNFI